MRVMWRKIYKWIEKNEWLILILTVVVILRIPTLFESSRYADEDIYLTLGQGLKKGLVFYRDIHDNKPPLLYIVAGIAGNVMWFRFILMVWNLVTVALIWKLLGVFTKKSKLIVLLTALFGLLTTLPLLEGEIANGELFMITPVIAGVLLLMNLSERDKKNKVAKSKNYFWVGLLFSIGFLFKVPVLFDVIGVLTWLSVYQLKDLRNIFSVFRDKRLWLSVLGFVIPLVLSIGYYYSMGAGEAYVRSALGQNIGYLSSWGGEKLPFYKNGLLQRGFVLFALSLCIILKRHKLGNKFGLASLWFSFALFGTFLSGRPYPHYLIEMVGPGVILMAVMFDKNKDKLLNVLLRVVTSLVLFGLMGFGIYYYKFWYYKSLPYYVNFAKYITGQESRESYLNFFGSSVVDDHKIAKYIRVRTDKNDRIYVWGTEPSIYALSNRLPAGRYTVSYHVRDFDGFDETIRAIDKYNPKYIVTVDGENVFEELRVLLLVRYSLVNKIGKASIWRVQTN